MRRRQLLIALMMVLPLVSGASVRESFNSGWRFSLGNAASMEADFTHGTEYFNYLTKVRSNNQSVSPIVRDYPDSAWASVTLPHDWVVDLPFSGEASHSHGYKCVGWKYPASSVGWYRKRFHVPEEARGRHVTVEFEGVFRDSDVFCNGIWLGGERSGYASSVYDLSDALDYGQDNVLTVRCNASLEEGWFYEGAGIYRNAWLSMSDVKCLEPYSVSTDYDASSGVLRVGAELRNFGHVHCGAEVEISLLDASGRVVAAESCRVKDLAPMRKTSVGAWLHVDDPHLWSPDDPYLHTLRIRAGEDVTELRVGLRTVEFTHDCGLLINGERVQMRGCDLHQDHAGVGSGIPDGLWRYRLERLREFGFNTVRSSHNPASPAMLDICDELGFLVIDENRLMGSNPDQLDLIERMVRRDRNHPCVVLWSVGNEEWAIEWDARGTAIAQRMTEVAHNADPTRLTVYGSSSGQFPNYGCDVFGYNYIVQNPVLENFASYPNPALGTEETTGCGTRGKYVTVPEEGWMLSLNRSGVRVDTRYSPDSLGVIERGWRFYESHPQFAGLCYWTGFDYRGEPNPMLWPATGSQFGLLDYCGFPKDEAFYLKANWTDDPLVHICGPVDGEVWVYSNCDRVRLYADGRSLGTQKVVRNAHLAWKVPSGAVITAVGYMGGRRVASDRFPELLPESPELTYHEYGDVTVVDVVCAALSPELNFPGYCVLGWGNGNPGFKEVERPLSQSSAVTVKTFCGRAQVILVKMD